MSAARTTFALLVVAFVISGCGEGDVTSLQERANRACGTDRTLTVKWHPGGFAAGESFETRCRRPNGDLYVVVTR